MKTRRKFKDVVTLHRGYDLPKRKRIPGIFPVISSSGINGFHSAMKVKGPGVIVGRSGNAGSVQYIDSSYWPLNTTLFVTDFHENNPLYIYNLLKNMNLRHYATGTTVPTLNRNHLDEIDVYVPDIKEQVKIACVLGYLDSKIKLNQQINKNLLRLIDNIYLQKYLTNSQVISASHVTLANLVNTKTKTFNPKKTSETLVNHFSMPAFDKAHYPVVNKVTNIKSNKNIVEPFSVLVSKMNPQVKRVWLPNVSDKILNVVSTEFLTFNADSAEMQAFIYAVVNNKSYQQFLIANTTGSTNSRQRVLPRVAYSFQISFNKTRAEMLGKILVPFLKKIKLIKYENQKLKKLRTLLLPKLLSESIDLSGIEEAIKDA